MGERIWLDQIESTKIYQRARLWMNRGLVDYLHKKVLVNKKRLRIAEVACGSGYAAHLISQYPEVSLSVAADINLEDFRQAAIANFGASFILMDLFHPSLTTESMDLVWNSSSIEELDRPDEALRSMCSLVKPGGLVFVGVPNRFSLAGFLSLLPSKRTKSWLGRSFDGASLKKLLHANGLEVIETTAYFFGVFIGALAKRPASNDLQA